MAEAGSFADRVKQQADIVRVIGEYVRLKKNGQNFTGLCPFHSEKTPSFAVHPVKQIYHCFGCGVGGDVFKFVMEMDKCDFLEAVRSVADKCGIAIPAPRERSPGIKTPGIIACAIRPSPRVPTRIRTRSCPAVSMSGAIRMPAFERRCSSITIAARRLWAGGEPVV